MKTLIDIFLEEPKKLERLIVLLLKFLLTCWIFEQLYSYDDIVDNVLRGDFQSPKLAEQLIFAVFLFVVWWFLVWIVFAEILIHLLVLLVSNIFNPAKDFREFISLFNKFIIKPDGREHINYAVIYLRDVLRANKENNSLDFSDMRFDVYLQFYSVVSLMLLISSSLELSCFFGILWAMLGIGLLFVNAYLQRLQLFVNSNFAMMSLEAETLAYIEEVKDVVSGMAIITLLYNVQYKHRFIELEYKVDISVPSTLKIVPRYLPEGALYRELFECSLVRDADKAKHDMITLYIANLPMNISQTVLKRSNSSAVIARDPTEMVQGLEIFLRILADERVSRALAMDQ